MTTPYADDVEAATEQDDRDEGVDDADSAADGQEERAQGVHGLVDRSPVRTAPAGATSSTEARQDLVLDEGSREEVATLRQARRHRRDRPAVGPQLGSSSSSQSIGAETGAVPTGRTEYGATSVLLLAFWV